MKGHITSAMTNSLRNSTGVKNALGPSTLKGTVDATAVRPATVLAHNETDAGNPWCSTKADALDRCVRFVWLS